MMKKILMITALAGVTFVNAQTDVTSHIANANFENGTEGWTVVHLFTQTNSLFSQKDGTTYLERWTPSGSLIGYASARQTLTGLTNGVYRLSAAAQNISQSNTSAAQTGAWVVGNGLRTPVTAAGSYSLDFFVTDGTAEVGFLCDGASGNWVACDGFQLSFLGSSASVIQSAANAVKTYASNLLANVGADTEYSNLISTLNTAISGGNLTTVANAAKAVAAGERTYRLRHPSGTAPTVTTRPRHARGCSWIFGRMERSGSNVVEEGFCWSTSPNPALGDGNYSTDWIDSYGRVIWMRNLTPGTIYYVRAYAMTKDFAVGYGDVIKVPTLPQGNIHWSYGDEGDDAINTRIRNAATLAFDHYWSNLTQLTSFWPSLHYASGTPTADCSYGGWMRIGPNTSYQKAGTIMHEALHGVGVGTHSMWGEFIRNQYPVWDALRFWDNNESSVLSGDGTHMWPYGVNGAQEDKGTEQLYIGNSLLCEALGEGGLPPTDGQWLLPYYAFTQDDNTKYYIKSEDKNRGLVNSFLVDNGGTLHWQELSADQAQADDKAAWYITFDAATQRYHIRNASTNRYIRYSNGFSTGTTATDIQMKKCRVDVSMGSQIYQGYYFLDYNSKQAMEAKTGGNVGSANFNIYDDATTQRWVILAQGQDMAGFESGALELQLDVLRHYLNGYAAAKNVAHTDKVSGATTALNTVLNTINSAISGTVTMEQVNQYVSDIKSAGLEFLNNTLPAGSIPYDLTFLIENPDFSNSTRGWSLDPTYSFGAVEFFQKTFDLYQTLPDMPAGTYQLTANAFQRPGANADVYAAYQAGTDNVSAMLYLNNSMTSQTIKNVMAEQQTSSISNGEYTTEGNTHVPNNMESGSNYFAAGKYVSSVQGEVAAGDLRIGLRGEVTADAYWTMADNFHLYFFGRNGEVLSLKEQLAANGFSRLTALPDDYSPYFFVLYDHSQDLTMVARTPNHQGGSKAMGYEADFSPMNNKASLWTLDAFTQDGTLYQVMANATYSDFMYQTEYNAGWNFRCSDNGAGNAGWGRTLYEYLPDGYWTIRNGVYPDAGYLGPWDNVIADDAETALNKTGDAVGHFDVFAILRGDYVKRFEAIADASYDNPLDITYVLENPGAERRTIIGWKSEGAAWEVQDNTALGGKVGDRYFQRWVASGAGTADLYQEIAGLPDGYYRFTAQTIGREKFYLYANDATASGTLNNNGMEVSVVVHVTDGNLRVGAKAVATASSWIAFDNARLEYLGNVVTLSDADTAAPTPASHVTVQLTRTLKGGQWNGFSVPFGFDLEGSALEGASVRKFGSANGNEITFAEETTAIKAGEPYLVKPTSDIANPTFRDVSITAPAEAVHGDGDYKFAAHLYYTDLPTDGSVAYVSTTDSSVKKLTSSHLKGLRSYFQIPTGSNAKALVLRIDGNTTAIDNLNGNAAEEDTYNLAGQRVQHARKGVFIVNGKKVVVK